MSEFEVPGVDECQPTARDDRSLVFPSMPGYLRRVRRLQDLSQRQLGTAMGLAPATIAALETGHRSLTLRRFEEVLALAGLRLAVVDGEGRVPSQEVIDHSGRIGAAGTRSSMSVAGPGVPPPNWTSNRTASSAARSARSVSRV